MPDEKKKRILIIDDDVPLNNLVKLALEDTGKYEVGSEFQPVNALEAARVFKPDLILLDLIMPQMDGGEVSLRFHQDPELSHVPIIIVSAAVSYFDRSGSGVVEQDGRLMLAKPIRLEQLMRCIDERLA